MVICSKASDNINKSVIRRSTSTRSNWETIATRSSLHTLRGSEGFVHLLINNCVQQHSHPVQRWRIFFEPRMKEYVPNHLGIRCCSVHLNAHGQIKIECIDVVTEVECIDVATGVQKRKCSCWNPAGLWCSYWNPEECRDVATGIQ